MRRLSIEKGVLDQALSLAGCLLGTFSMAMSVGKPTLAYTLASLTLALGAAGYIISVLIPDRVRAVASGWILFVGCLLAAFSTRAINVVMPDEGFPPEVGVAGVLSYVILAGCLLAWSDATLLFLSVPCIALFGLVGVFDQYHPAVFLFFIFLICISVLYARVHQRIMVRRAEALGADAELLRRGQWKWMAGPEWAVASAGVIVLFSLFGAPIIQSSVSGISGKVTVMPPQSLKSLARPAATASFGQEPVGTGPVNLSDEPVLEVEIDKPRYLRRDAFLVFSGHGWTDNQATRAADVKSDTTPEGEVQVTSRTGLARDAGTTVTETLFPRKGLTGPVPAAGEIVKYQGLGDGFINAAGGFMTTQLLNPGSVVTLQVAPPGDPASDSASSYRAAGFDLGSARRTPDTIQNLADEAVAGARTPLEKARAIEEWVGKRCQYNTHVPAVPGDTNAVTYFLSTSKQGYCDLFASAVAELARAEGLPARYATGFLMSGEKDQYSGRYIVREHDSHAWAEIYFEKVGWVPFDATAYSQDVSGTGSTEKANSFFDQPWVKAVGAFAGTLAVLVLGVFVVPAVMRRQGPGTFVKTEPLIHRQNAFQSMVYARVGHPRRFSMTIREYVTAHEEGLGEAFPKAMGIVEVFESMMFSPRGSKPDFTVLDDRLRELRAVFKSMPKPEKK